MQKYINKLFVFILCFFSSYLYALTPDSILPLPIRSFIDGNTGTNSFGQADIMLPMLGNSEQIIFANPLAKYGKYNTWLLSFGVGGRSIVDNKAIVGGYLFTDYNKTEQSNYFSILNPGLEFFTIFLDGHINAYIPLSKRQERINSFVDDGNHTFFSGHSQYSYSYSLIEEIGAGLDFELGKTFYNVIYPGRFRTFGAGYFFRPKNTDNINGIQAGIEFFLRNNLTSIEFRDSYDNLNHNTFIVTLRVMLGGLLQTQQPDIHNRMLDRIPRHLGNLYNGNGIPSQERLVESNLNLIQDNIWFFNADGAPSIVSGFQSCTFENPCIGLEQTQIDTINALSANANFFFSSGTYINPNEGSGFTFYNGQNLFGRTLGFLNPATGSNRPILNDSILLNGNNNLYNLIINGNSTTTILGSDILVGLSVEPAGIGMVNVYNSEITATSLDFDIFIAHNGSNSAILNIYNSTISGTMPVDSVGTSIVGIINELNGTTNVIGSNISVSNIADLVDPSNAVTGAGNVSSGQLNIENSTISTVGVNIEQNAGIINSDLDETGIGTINIKNSEISVSSNGVQISAAIANDGINSSGTINVDTVSIILSSTNNLGFIVGAITYENGTININNSTITGETDSAIIAGLIVNDAPGTINYQNNLISLNATGGSFGAPTGGPGTLNDNGGNQCIINGVVVPCQ